MTAYIITFLAGIITVVGGYLAKLINDKERLETSNRQLKEQAITGPLEGKSHESQEEAIAAVRNYESMLADFERISSNPTGTPPRSDKDDPRGH